MLYFSRWRTAAILGTTLIVCLPALTNVLPAATFDSLPTWAQRKIELGVDLGGGEHVQFEVDAKDARKQMVEQLRGDTRDALRQARIGYTGLVVRDDGIELRVREEADFSKAATYLRKVADMSAGADVSFDGRLVRLTLTRAAIAERITQGRNGSIRQVAQHLQAIGVKFRVAPAGSDRVVLDVLEPFDPSRMVMY
jgi:preprotein translocase subunit SecD